jgi:hypothetical protein
MICTSGGPVPPSSSFFWWGCTLCFPPGGWLFASPRRGVLVSCRLFLLACMGDLPRPYLWIRMYTQLYVHLGLLVPYGYISIYLYSAMSARMALLGPRGLDGVGSAGSLHSRHLLLTGHYPRPVFASKRRLRRPAPHPGLCLCSCGARH